MAIVTLEGLPEVFVSTTGISHAVGRLRREGTLRRIGPRIYTRNLTDTPEQIVQRNLWPLIGSLLPGAIISHRTAFELKPFNDTVFVTDSTGGKLVLPGLTIVRTKGAGPVDGDTKYIAGLYLASRARAFLENLQPSRGAARKTIGRPDLEGRLARIAAQEPEAGLNRIRDAARAIAGPLSAEREFAALDNIIGALQRTRKARLSAPQAIALHEDRGFDTSRATRFAELHAVLRDRAFADRPVRPVNDGAFQNAAFFDAYFSNYIEGTQFEVDEAIAIVFEHRIPERRPADAHDVTGTFGVVGSLDNMLRQAKTFDGFVDLLRDRHRTILSGRPEMEPGAFKRAPNKVGTTVFVLPPLVAGTLQQGWDLLGSLEHPFARALFIMFVVAEVHPFNDGNGRIARAMMNAELIAGGQCRIMIPSVFRNEYIGGLRRLTNHGEPEAFLRVMDYAQTFVSQVDFTDLDAARQLMTRCNAFEDPADDRKLLLPNG